ncbi:reverse transcriptase domain-containing protein [Kribbella sp. CA-245084]|uniref:reverse transcriptase domain-containing protein n=1 Tax=Kribbella sp. CA-245084 TaxID=3239940 RepID=UPI003D8D444A
MTARADALFELSDAVLCACGPVTSLVELPLIAERHPRARRRARLRRSSRVCCGGASLPASARDAEPRTRSPRSLPRLTDSALSAPDEHFARKWEALGPDWTRAKHRRDGGPIMKLVRYADDFVIMVGGRREQADALWDEVAAVLAPMGLRPSVAKTRVCHIDEGFDFLGWHIQRQAWRSRSGKRAVYT